MAALPEQGLRMRLLEIPAPDLGRRDLGRNRGHRHAAAMRVEQPVDEMQIAGAAGAGADRQLAGHLRFAGSGEGGHFLVPHMHPRDGAPAPQCLREAVQAVTDDSVDSLYAGLLHRRDEQIGYVSDCHHGLQQMPVSALDVSLHQLGVECDGGIEHF